MKYRSERDRLRCIGAGLLLIRELGIREESEILYTPDGKPFLARAAGNKWMLSFLCFVLADGGLTTAIGMSSAAANYFSTLTKKKISYELLIIVICISGFLISNLGIDSIIRMASPILTILYPVVLTQVILSFFRGKIKKPTIFRRAALGALITAVAEALADVGVSMPFVDNLPLAAAGFSWVLPAIAGGLIGAMIPSAVSQP